jgi:cyclase
MQVEKLSDRLTRFTLSSTDFTVNLIASIGRDGILLVDTGWAQTAEELNEKISKLSDDIVKLIIFTHQHGDHIGGRGVLGKDATLIAHKNAKDELAGKYFALDPLPGQELPLITLENELSLHFNGEEIKIVPAPGHTSSDTIVHFIDSGVVCMGDLLFSGTYPVIFPAYGGNVDQYLETIERLIDLFPADVKLTAGHGRDYSLEELKEYYQMAVSTTDLIKQGVADGKKPKEMIEENLLKDWEKWSSPQVTSESWITQVYESLTDQGKKSIAEPLTHTIMEKGIATAIEQYHQLRKNQPDAYNFGENELNMLGYQLLWRDMNEAAIEVHKLNILAYPDSANPYDSLADAYEASGEIALAIECYEKVLELDPEMPSAIDGLKRLKSEVQD